jgi:hypothetical protein
MKITCPLCGATWTEHKRQRGACVGCGAGEDEMFRALYRRVDAVERRMTRAVCVEPNSGDSFAWVVNMRPDVPDPSEDGEDFGGGTFMEAVGEALKSRKPAERGMAGPPNTWGEPLPAYLSDAIHAYRHAAVFGPADEDSRLEELIVKCLKFRDEAVMEGEKRIDALERRMPK